MDVTLPTDQQAFLAVVEEEAYGRAPKGVSGLLAKDAEMWRVALVDLVESVGQQLNDISTRLDEHGLNSPSRRADLLDQRSELHRRRVKFESRLRYVNVLTGKRNGSHNHPWIEFVEWILGDYQADEWEALYQDVPPALRTTLQVADRKVRGERR